MVVWLTWYGEGGHDPAVGVQDVARHAVVDAGDLGADQIIGGDENAADETESGGGPVVELEEGGLNLRLGAPVASLDEPGHRHKQVHHRHGDSVSQTDTLTLL